MSALLFCTARLVQAQPAWNVDPSAFNQTMTMVGTLYLDGASATDPEDIVAALIDGEVRGVAGEDQVQVFEGQWYYFMTIYANTTGENITFQVYDASLDDIRLITETLTFTGGEVGSLDYPFIWSQSPVGCTYGDPTTWATDTNYENTMTILGMPQIDGMASDDPDDRVVAFVDGNVHGVTPPPTQVNGDYLFFLSIGGDDEDEDAMVTFQVFDASENVVRDIEQAVPFKAGTSQGSPGAPFSWTTEPSCDTTLLPVELVAFEAVIDTDGVLLRWTTASETYNAGFEVQHAAEGAGWAVLGFVGGAGTTAAPQHYRYHAADVVPGRHRFRLKQIDYDGTFEYSPQVEVAIGVMGTHQLSAAYPNPFNPQTAFSLAVGQVQEVRIEVYDVLGRRVALLHEGTMQANASRMVVWEAGDRPGGLYFIRVLGERFAETRQVTLIK